MYRIYPYNFFVTIYIIYMYKLQLITSILFSLNDIFVESSTKLLKMTNKNKIQNMIKKGKLHFK